MNLEQIDNIEDEGLHTYYLTHYLLTHYPQKKWVLDAGALQMVEAEWLLALNGNAILTPHTREFERLFELQPSFENVAAMSKKYNVIILLKGEEDIICNAEKCILVKGGNAGMTKGGTGDVLAGLIAALSACTNDLFLAASAGSYINKKTGEALFEQVGYYFNASDLANEIPKVMKKLLIPR